MNDRSRLLKMIEETWYGIPRDKIPWCQAINYEKCITCGKCVEYCTTEPSNLKRKMAKNEQS